MPMSTREAQRVYAREWVRKRRQAWLAANGPCRAIRHRRRRCTRSETCRQCGSTDRLEVDHIAILLAGVTRRCVGRRVSA